jgi:arylsulfatase A-like enzyme
VLHTFADGRILETIDDDIAQRSVAYIQAQARARKPFFVGVNFTHMHLYTHVRPDAKGKTGISEYADAMLTHDENVGQVLKAMRSGRLAL